jgi:DNA anti-recombination protein RmuC
MKYKLILCCLYFCLAGSQIYAYDNTSQQSNLAERLTRLEEGQKAILLEMRTRFEAMNTRMDDRFAAMNKRMDDQFAAMNKQMDDRFAAMNKQMDDRFAAMNKRIDDRFAAMNKQMDDRFAAMNKRIDDRFAAMNKQMDDRFGTMDKRIDDSLSAMDKRIDDHFASMDIQINFLMYFSIAIFTSFIAMIGFLIWDRKTAIDKASEKFEAVIEKYQLFNCTQTERITANSSHSNVQTTNTKEKQETALSLMQKQLNYIIDVMKQIPEIHQKMQADNFQGNVPANAAFT